MKDIQNVDQSVEVEELIELEVVEIDQVAGAAGGSTCGTRMAARYGTDIRPW